MDTFTIFLVSALYLNQYFLFSVPFSGSGVEEKKEHSSLEPEQLEGLQLNRGAGAEAFR